MNEKDYKVQKVVIKNFKGIEDMTMDVNGQHVILIGDNKLCKSSATDAIWTSLSAKRIPQQPIRKGADKAETMVIVGNDEVEYQIERKYTEKGSYLEITSPEGFKTSKIANLTSLIGDIDFNIFEFVELGRTVPGRREQVSIIKRFMNEQVVMQLDEKNGEIFKIKETRAGLNVRLRDLKGLVNTESKKYDFEDAEKFSKPKDLSEINDRYRTALEHNSTWTQFVNKYCPDLESSFVDADEIVDTIEKKITSLRDKITELGDEIKKVRKFDRADTNALKAEYEAAKEHNDKVDQVKGYLEHKEELEKKKKEYEKWGAKVYKIESENQKLIAGSEIPVEGLTFDENGLYLNGLPFTEDQLATSELIEVGVKLAIAKKPKVKIIRVSHGESLGSEIFTDLIRVCNKKGYQLFIEEVDTRIKQLKLQYFNDEKDLK